MPWNLLVPLRVTTLTRRTAVAAELGGEVRRLDLHLLDEAQADVVDLTAVRARVEVRPAVDGQVVGIAPAAVDRLARHAEAGRQRERIEVGRDRSGDERRQLEVVAAVEREVLDLLRVDGARHLAARPIDRLAQRGRDFDRLVQFTDAEREVRRERPSAVSENPVRCSLRKPCISAETE